MSIQVRPGRMEDLFDLVRFAVGVAKETEGIDLDKAVVRDATAAALQDPHKARYFVAEEIEGQERRLVGSLFVTFEWTDWRGGWNWWIQSAYVVPERRRQGVFRQLYDAVLAAARQEDVQRIRLYVEAENDAGQATYRALGMDETPRPYRIYEASVSPE